MIGRLEAFATPRRRKWLYRVAWSVLALAGVYGVLTGEQLAAWLVVAAAVLGVADGHTDPTTPTGQPSREQVDPEQVDPEQ